MSGNAPAHLHQGRRAGRALLFLIPASLILAVLLLNSAGAQTTTPSPPSISINLDTADSPDQVAVVMEIFLLLTVLSIAPAILIMLTAFTRIVVVLSVLRQAMGTQQMPPNQVIIGLAIFLTYFVMQPVLVQVHQEAVQPYLNRTITLPQAIETAAGPLRTFMFAQTREKDLALFIRIAEAPRPNNVNEVATHILIPAFIISELKTAFEIAFLLYVPFLIVDMVVASVLLSMGMMMLPPVMVSLPFKMMLFVLVDGWNLIVGSLVKSFGV